MYNTYIKDTDSHFGNGSTKFESEAVAERNYLLKYPEEENNINNIEWDTEEV